MRIVCLVPEDHFHAPVVLARLARREEVRLLAILTPKIPLGLGRIVEESGFRYLLSMACMKGGFLLRSLLEVAAGHRGDRRRFRNVPRVLRDRGIPSVRVRDINGPETMEAIAEFGPDLILSIFFNQIIRRDVRDLAPQALNVHPSFLPAYRGVSPVFWQMRNGEVRGGATIHRLTDEVDAGEILLRREVPIPERATLFEHYRDCALAAADLLDESLPALVRGEIPPVPVDEEAPSTFGKITREAMREFHNRGRRFF